MDNALFAVPLWVELVAAGLGGLQGAMFAAGYRDHRIDVLGVVAIGIGTSLGGSLLRDVVLNQPPVVVWSNWYLLVAAAGALIGMALEHIFQRLNWLITGLDAVVIGLFGAIGTSKALVLGVPTVGAIFIGVIAAVGGSVVRDVSLGLPVAFLQVGSLYAVAAGAGAGLLVLLDSVGVPIPASGLACVIATTVIRLAAVRFRWTFPEQTTLRHVRR
ncbi:hypothetical protein ELQ92_02765 [Labedella populi]|uniref:Glycine transporter domain-containing protein n=1 Tax=Labedella populi TaxID=2498850 RepID=A0A3S3ZZ86_9MICO|nr:TRIC cation channel family protein [Labedella populi]RWZ68175.1 hypothetical protein ELQ92_02765 [Labedella populi]